MEDGSLSWRTLINRRKGVKLLGEANGVNLRQLQIPEGEGSAHGEDERETRSLLGETARTNVTGKALSSLVPNYPVLCIFAWRCISSEVRQVSGLLSSYVVTQELARVEVYLRATIQRYSQPLSRVSEEFNFSAYAT